MKRSKAMKIEIKPLVVPALLVALAPVAGAALYKAAPVVMFGIGGARGDDLALVCGACAAVVLVYTGVSRLIAALRL